ncbi:MAG: ImmA/IrrE family metallo-endopeptidase [Candidatus Dormibacteria bacterium]
MALESLAQELGVELMPADRLVPIERLRELEQLQDDAFSAATFRRRDGGRVVVFNPLHSRGRTRSDQAHELAHIILQHTLRTVERVGGFSFLTCDVEQEEEADWLGGCLLLPRPLLLKAAFSRKSPAQLAKECETSEHMARFRLNASGVLVQMGRAKAGSRSRGAQRGP